MRMRLTLFSSLWFNNFFFAPVLISEMSFGTVEAWWGPTLSKGSLLLYFNSALYECCSADTDRVLFQKALTVCAVVLSCHSCSAGGNWFYQVIPFQLPALLCLTQVKVTYHIEEKKKTLPPMVKECRLLIERFSLEDHRIIEGGKEHWDHLIQLWAHLHHAHVP